MIEPVDLKKTIAVEATLEEQIASLAKKLDEVIEAVNASAWHVVRHEKKLKQHMGYDYDND